VEELLRILKQTKDRYEKYYLFNEISEYEYFIRRTVLEEIENEIEYNFGDSYDG